MKIGLVALLVSAALVSEFSSAAAGPKDKGEASLLSKAMARSTVTVSPDRQKYVEVASSGKIRLNGQQVLCGSGRLMGDPIWRRDSKALALLLRSATGIQLVVLPELEVEKPLIWRLPALAESTLHLFWISSQRLGVGTSAFVPRVIVSWTTTTSTN
jgi:hypothetical protein